MTRRRTIRVDFRKMPEYTKPERYAERQWERENDPHDYDPELAKEMDDLLGLNDDDPISPFDFGDR